jgi:hypothetical protein
MHHFVHGSTFAAHSRYMPSVMAPSVEGVVEIGGDAADLQPYREGTLLLSARAVLHATRAVCVLLGNQEPGDVDVLLADIEAIAEENNRASASSAASG